MAAPADTASMALFCDFENIALGVRDAQYDKFDIRPILERLLAKGSIVVKKAYCDWDRYKAFKAAMHEANFELIEIPHVRQSGKNSADIRMVVDALDLCYTKAHVDTFVIISGDSDFSPLVSKLRENAKRVIGVGVKQSCSDLLVTNCDEFIYYDDLVRDREAQRVALRRDREKRAPEGDDKRRDKVEERRNKAVELVAATFADMMADRGDTERIWASVVKEVIKRRNPGFNESYFGFRSFGALLDEAAQRGHLNVGRDEKSGTYVTRALARPAAVEPAVEEVVEAPAAVDAAAPAKTAALAETVATAEGVPKAGPAAVETASVEEAPAPRRRGGRRTRKEVAAVAEAGAAEAAQPVAAAMSGADVSPEAPAAAPVESAPGVAVVAGEAPAKKRAARSPRARKPKAAPAGDAA